MKLIIAFIIRCMKHLPAKTFRDLFVWQRAHQLTLSIYERTKNFPREELYGLTSQIRRSAMSVAANICEGFKKLSPADKLRILNISQGSLSETKYYLILSRDLKLSETTDLMVMADEVSRLLESYMQAIRKK